MQKLLQIGKQKLWLLTLLGGLVLLTFYSFYRITFINFSPGLAILSIILFIADLHTIFHLYGMFYCLWPRKYVEYNEINRDKNLRINMFICVCGEPVEVIAETIKAAIRTRDHYIDIVHPKYKPRVIVLNDGKVAGKDNWKDVQKAAKELGVMHVARTIKGGFKAGNINNGVSLTPTPDAFNTIDIVFDSDFAAKRNFLTEITKPFVDKTVDFAQSPQRYKNEKNWVAKASAAHQIFFFDYICRSKAHDNALFLCGTNFAIRRSALNDVGGIDTNFITEDYATSLELHLNGKKGVFIPKVIAIGMAPTSLKAYFTQQQRWSKGSFDTTFFYLKRILFGPMTLRQKFHYTLSATYYMIGLRDMLLMLAPLPYLLFGVSLIKPNTSYYLALIYAPLMIYNFILYTRLFKHPLKSLVLDIASFPVFVSAFFSSVLKKDLSFIVTIKKYEKENPLSVYKLQLLVVAILSIGLFIGFHHTVNTAGALLNYFWASFDVFFLSLGFYMIIRENYNTSFIDNTFSKISGLFRLPKPAYAFSVIVLLAYLIIKNPATIISAQEAWRKVTANFQTQSVLVPQDGVYYGYYLPSSNDHTATPITSLLPNEKTSLGMIYQDWVTSDTFDINFMNKYADAGITPIITWEPWDSTQIDTADLTKATFSMSDIINGKYDDLIKGWALSAADYKKPFFIRFAHEMNGNWYPWGEVNGNTPEMYKQMWIHVHNIFVANGATNVIWIWSPNNTDEYGSVDSILSFYPGDAYVDWTGFSDFNWGTTNKYTKWTAFEDSALKTYGQLNLINKPIIVAETSSVSTGGDKYQWFDDLIKSLPSFKKIKAVIFFDENIDKADFSLYSGDNFEKIINEDITNNNYFLKGPVLKTF